MKKILFILMSIGSAPFVVAECVDGDFPAVKLGVPNATSRCSYTIDANIVYNAPAYAKFLSDLRTDYRGGTTGRDFVVVNETTKEAYHLNQGDLYLDGISTAIDNRLFNFISIDGRNQYSFTEGKANSVDPVRIVNALSSTFIEVNYIPDKKLKENLLPIITALPEAVKFLPVAKGIGMNKVKASWNSSYGPIVKNWDDTLKFMGKSRGEVLTIEDSLKFLQSEENKKDCEDVLNNVAGPAYNIWGGYCQ